MSEVDLLIVFVVSLAGSFIKAVTGMGYPLIAVPILTLVFGIESAIAVIAVPNIFANLALVWTTREECSLTRDLPVLVSTAAVGAIFGAFVLVEAPERPLALGLALTVLLFVVQRIRAPKLSLDPATTARWSPLVGLAAGFSHGAVGASGPIVALWFHGYRLSKDAYVFSVASIFLVGGLAQLGVLIGAGSFGRDRIVASGIALAATLAMIPLGARVRNRMAGDAFEKAILILLVFSGISLLWRAIG